MRKLKGKWLASYKDTYSLDSVLSPIILSGLVKFRDVLAEREKNGSVYGVPIFDDNYGDEPQSEKWFEILDKIIFAFDDKNEPDISEYDIGFNWDKVNGIDFGIMNKDNLEKYREDKLKYEKDKQEGLDLFAKYYNNLWW